MSCFCTRVFNCPPENCLDRNIFTFGRCGKFTELTLGKQFLNRTWAHTRLGNTAPIGSSCFQCPTQSSTQRHQSMWTEKRPNIVTLLEILQNCPPVTLEEENITYFLFPHHPRFQLDHRQLQHHHDRRYHRHLLEHRKTSASFD